MYRDNAMTIYIKDATTDEAARKLAELRGVSLSEAIRDAVEKALREERRRTLPMRLDAIAKGLQKYPRTGLEADKAFYDELSGDI
jgi:antitoxin VapB